MMENLSELDHSAIDNDFFSNMSTAKAVLAIPKFLPKLESAIESARSFSRREIFLSDNGRVFVGLKVSDTANDLFEDEISQELEQIASDSTDPILALKRIVSLQSNIEKLTKEDPYFFAKKVSKNDIFPGIDSCEKVCHTEEKVYDHEVILSPDDIKSVYRARERRTLLLLPGRSNNSLSIYLRSNNFLFHTKYHYWYSVDKKEDAMSIVNSIREMCSLPRHKFGFFQKNNP